jgi:DNA-binding PadR family transcriptional regulator
VRALTSLPVAESTSTSGRAAAAEAKDAQPSPLGLLVLWQLNAAPNHAYGLQKLFEQQGKDRVVNLRSRANLQQAIKRLQRLGLVEVRETVRGEGYPDRIVYAITDAGREAARAWLRELLSESRGEFPDFIAAVSILFGIEPDDARAQLEHRAEQLAETLADTEAQLQGNPELPRLFLLEEEYRRAILGAELTWLRSVIDDLRSGRLTWSWEWLAETFAAFHPDVEGQAEG